MALASDSAGQKKENRTFKPGWLRVTMKLWSDHAGSTMFNLK